MATTWPVLVSIHNVVRVPKEVAALNTPGLRFRVAVSAVGRDAAGTSALSNVCPEVSSTFEPKEVQMIQQNHYEVKLDGTSGSGRGSIEWHCPSATVDVLVSIKEETLAEGSKTIAAAEAFPVNLEEIIERRKLRTLVVNTTMGYVGISFSVAPSDTAGYRRRLEAFLTKYNPASLKHVANVVASVSEVDTFTKVNKKYRLVDYPQRIRKFFSTYGPENLNECEVIQKQWENREEELMRNLILDNGPELCDVDFKQRLSAFVKKYKIPQAEVDVAAAVSQHGRDPEPFMEQLTAKYGAEPDPRVYLFGPTFYGDKPPEALKRAATERRPPPPASAPIAATTATASTAKPSTTASAGGAPPLPPASAAAAPSAGLVSSQSFGRWEQSSVFPSHVAEPVQQQQQPQLQQQQRDIVIDPPRAAATPPSADFSGTTKYASSANLLGSNANGTMYELRRDDPSYSRSGVSGAVARSGGGGGGGGTEFIAHSAPPSTPPASAAVPAVPPMSSMNVVELWSRLIEDLRSASIPPAELHYLNEPAFSTLLSELGYNATSKQLLIAEWNRRVTAALRVEQLSSGDALFEAAKRDVITISGLHPLNVQVVGVTMLKNAEHESSFSIRLGDAKLRTTERLLLVGEHHKLLASATYGVSQHPQLETSLPAAVFHRRAFHALQRPTSVSVLVCDVIIGKPLIGSPGATGDAARHGQLTAPKEATPSFLKEYDSCVFFDPTAGQSVAVYQPQQVLPKFLVQCNVDTTVSPCPAHPSKAVEYFVVDANVFACSQCVVMGQHRGKEVLTVDDATLQARSQVQDLQRDALLIVSEMAAVEADCERQLQSLAHSDVRQNVARQIELIRREAEQRVSALLAEVEAYERQRRETTEDAKAQAKRVMEDAQSLSQQLEDGLRMRGASDVLSLLINVKRSGTLDILRERSMVARQPILATESMASSLPQQSTHTGSMFPSGSVTLATSSSQLANGAEPFRLTPLGTAAVAAAKGGANMMTQAGTTRGTAATSNSTNNVEGLIHTPRAGATASTAAASSGAASADVTDASALYSRFLSIKQQAADSAPPGRTPMGVSRSSTFLEDTTIKHPNTAAAAAAGVSNSRLAASRASLEMENKRMKDLITSGWAEFRKGDRLAAHRIWQDVFERNPNNAIGARAKAYIAEAIEKNYPSASHWYEKALTYDPQDCLTLYNYGVLLESVLDRKRDALQLFETAHRLGDQTAGKRAAVLRQTI